MIKHRKYIYCMKGTKIPNGNNSIFILLFMSLSFSVKCTVKRVIKNIVFTWQTCLSLTLKRTLVTLPSVCSLGCFKRVNRGNNNKETVRSQNHWLCFLIWQRYNTSLQSLLLKSFIFGLQNATRHFLCLYRCLVWSPMTTPSWKNVNLPLSSRLIRMMPFTIQIKSEPSHCSQAAIHHLFFIKHQCKAMLWFFLMSLSSSLILPSDVVVSNDMIS